LVNNQTALIVTFIGSSENGERSSQGITQDLSHNIFQIDMIVQYDEILCFDKM